MSLLEAAGKLAEQCIDWHTHSLSITWGSFFPRSPNSVIFTHLNPVKCNSVQTDSVMVYTFLCAVLMGNLLCWQSIKTKWLRQYCSVLLRVVSALVSKNQSHSAISPSRAFKEVARWSCWNSYGGPWPPKAIIELPLLPCSKQTTEISKCPENLHPTQSADIPTSV